MTFRAALLCHAIFFLSDIGHAIRHFVILPKGQMNASMTLQPLVYDGGMHCLYFSNVADWWQEEHAWLFGNR
jgi:hypothetical protein